MRFLTDLKIFHKITASFIFLAVLIAIVTVPLTCIWISNLLTKDVYLRLKSGIYGIEYTLHQEEMNLKNTARALAQSAEVEKAVLGKDVISLRKISIPYKTALDMDFIEVIDERGRVLANFGGPFPENWELSNLDIVRRGFLEMNDVDLITEGDVNRLVVASPIRSPSGLSGLILMGTKIDQSYLNDLVLKPKETHLSLFRGKRLAATTFTDLKKHSELDLPEDLARSGLSRGAYEIESKEIKGRPYYFIYAPLYLSNRSIGFLSLALDAQGVMAAKRQATGNIILLNLLIIVVMLTLAYVIINTFAPSVERLLIAARKIASGETVEDILVTTKDEIGQLGEAFNQMLGSLRNQSEALTRRVLELSLLHDTSRVLSSSRDLKQSINTVLESTLKVFDADIGCMSIIDDETGELTTGLCRSNSSVNPKGRLYLERIIAEKVVEEGKAVRFNRFQDKRAPITTKAMGNLKSVLAVPIILENRALGMISAGNVKQVTFTDEDEKLLVTLAGQTAVALENTKLFESLENAYLETVRALAAAVDAKDSYTRGHSEQVAKYALMVAEELNLSEEEKVAIETSAYLHDIGKIGIGDDVLLKEGILDESEISIIRSHPLLGANILRSVTFPWKVVPAVLHHHEHYSGGGYPAGLKKREIPLGARILALADAFDAITSDRPYRKARSMEEAVEELKRCAGTQFDPTLVNIFLSTLKQHGFISSVKAKDETQPAG